MADKANAQFTDDAFLGSGALGYSWYNQIRIKRTGPEDNVTDWVVTFKDNEEEPVSDKQAEYTIDHTKIMTTVNKIVHTGRANSAVSVACQENCRYLIAGNLDEVDFDCDTADQVLQVAAFGKVIYG